MSERQQELRRRRKRRRERLKERAKNAPRASAGEKPEEPKPTKKKSSS